MEPWDQERFERLLTEWVITSDQPFDEVDNPTLRELLQYTHNCGQKLHIPSRASIRRRVMKMSADSVEETKQFFKVVPLEKMSIISHVTYIRSWTPKSAYRWMLGPQAINMLSWP